MRRMRTAASWMVGLCAVGAGALAQYPPRPAPVPLSPFGVEALAPLLATWIVSERDAAKAQGVEPIPPAIRAALEGYVPKRVLDRVREPSLGVVRDRPVHPRDGHEAAERDRADAVLDPVSHRLHDGGRKPDVEAARAQPDRERGEEVTCLVDEDEEREPDDGDVGRGV